MFAPPPPWPSTMAAAIPVVEATPTCPASCSSEMSLRSSLFSIFVAVCFFIIMTASQYASQKYKRLKTTNPPATFQPMSAVVIPPSPVTSRAQRSRESPSTPASQTSISTVSCYSPSSPGSFISIPEGFPRGPGLVLSREQIRLALLFSPKDRRSVDPEETYWGRGRKSHLRTRFWGILFEKKDYYDLMRDESPYELPLSTLRSNIGADWMLKARYFERPDLYNSQGRLRDDPEGSSDLVADDHELWEQIDD